MTNSCDSCGRKSSEVYADERTFFGVPATYWLCWKCVEEETPERSTFDG